MKLCIIILFAVFVACAYGITLTHPTTITRPYPNQGYGIPILADIDGDGRNDIVINSQTNTSTVGEVSWSRNLGGYSFGSFSVIYTYNGYLPPLDSADLDNDGDRDLVIVANYNGTYSQAIILENLGSAVFTAHTSVLVTQTWVGLGLLDFNNDNLIDIILGSDPYVTAYQNQGRCVFSWFSTVNAGLGWIGPAAFAQYSQEFATYSNVLFSGTWGTYDGYFYSDGTSIKFFNVGAPGAQGTYNSWTVGVTDLNGDSRPDLAVSGYNCFETTFYLNGASSWSGLTSVAGLGSPSCGTRAFVSAGDVDGNGYGDVVYAQNNNVYIATWGSSGQTTPNTLVGTFTGSSSVNPPYQTFTVGSVYSIKDIVVMTATTIEIYTACQSCATCAANSYYNFTTSSCSACASGYKSNAGAWKCLPICHRGTTYTNPGCTICPAGSYSAAADAPFCTKCKANEVSPGGVSPCTTCPANSYPVANSQCLLCPAGTYSAAKSVACTACPLGTIRNTADATCTACPAGTYALNNQCQQCAAGTYSSAVGATVCTSCPSGYVASSPGSATCTACPSGQSSYGGLYCH